MKKIDLTKWPFIPLVVLSLILSALHGVLQLGWAAIRYRSFGHRPLAAQVFIGSELLLLMVIFTIGMIHISDPESSESSGRYYIGIAATVCGWIAVLFVI